MYTYIYGNVFSYMYLRMYVYCNVIHEKAREAKEQQRLKLQVRRMHRL